VSIANRTAETGQSVFGWTAATISYYEHTLVDYQSIWLNQSNLALHFGFHDDQSETHTDALDNTNRTLARIARVRAGDRVLDAGCGLGGSSFWLAQNLRAHAVGITLSQDQVDRASCISLQRGLSSKVGFHRADFTATPFPDASFDVVWAVESLCHAEVKSRFYLEAARVLRPGGRLVIAEFIRTTRRLSQHVERVIREWLDGWAIPDLDTGQEHVDAATAAGLRDVRLRDYTVFTRPSLRRLYRLALLASPVNEVMYRLGVRNRTQHANVVASIRQYQALETDSWFYGVLSATKQ
jgi:tocopherol O-methyltransferase